MPARFRFFKISAGLLPWLAAMALLIPGPRACARDLQVLRAAYSEFPPYTYTNQQGQPAGRIMQLTEKVAQRAGYKLEMRALPTARIYLYLKEGRTDLWLGVSQVPALKGYVVESRVHPVTIKLCAWHLPGTPPLKSLQGLRGHSVILINGYTYGGLAGRLMASGSGVSAFATTTHLSALQMLVRRRADYLLDYREPVEAALREHSLPPVQSTILKRRPAAYVFSRKLPHAKAVARAFDKAYAELVAAHRIHAPAP